MWIKELVNRIKERNTITNEKSLGIYFAHPITTYFSKQAHEALNAIENKFPSANILNPAKLRSQEMSFYLTLVESANIIIFMTNPRLRVGKGVFDEIQHAKSLKKEIYFYHPLKKQFYSVFTIKKLKESNWEKYAMIMKWES